MVCSWCSFKHSTSWSSSSKVDSDVRVVYSSFFSHGFQGLKSMYRRLLPGGKTWHGDYWTVYNLSVIKISRKVGLSSQPSKTRGNIWVAGRKARERPMDQSELEGNTRSQHRGKTSTHAPSWALPVSFSVTLSSQSLPRASFCVQLVVQLFCFMLLVFLTIL